MGILIEDFPMVPSRITSEGMEGELARAWLGRQFDAQESDTDVIRALRGNLINAAVESRFTAGIALQSWHTRVSWE